MGAADQEKVMPLDYKTVLITGASSGLGRGLAQWFAARPGTTVYAAARRTAALESLRAQAGGAIVPVTLDVSKGDETHARVKALDAEVNGFDLVIANAGLAPHTWARQLDWAVVKNLREALPAVTRGAARHVVEKNITCTASFPQGSIGA